MSNKSNFPIPIFISFDIDKNKVSVSALTDSDTSSNRSHVYKNKSSISALTNSSQETPRTNVRTGTRSNIETVYNNLSNPFSDRNKERTNKINICKSKCIGASC